MHFIDSLQGQVLTKHGDSPADSNVFSAGSLSRSRQGLRGAARNEMEGRAALHDGRFRWLAELAGAQKDPRRLDIVRQQLSGAERVTAADVQHAAQVVLADDKAFKLIVESGK